MNLIKRVINKKKKIVFPEGDDERILKAVKIIKKKKIAIPIVINPKTKLIGIDSFKTKNPVEYAMNLVKKGNADGCVCGATHSTMKTIRNALKIIGGKFVSSFFLFPEKKLLFADCGLNINPNSEQLAKISEQTAKSAKMFGIKPKVAMLSYSTLGSGKGESVNKVNKATNLVKKRNPKLIIDGELQFDSAFCPDIAKIKKSKKIKGDANVFIFPNLDSGNISYKIAERIGNLQALGPILQGLNKPVNDLSRGCSVDDIVKITAITALQSIKK